MSAPPYRPLPPPVPYFGAKGKLAPRIVALFPPHQHYVEPFMGSLAVLLAKPPSTMETVNDLDQHLVTFFRVLRDRTNDLERVCALTPHARADFRQAETLSGVDDDLERARRVWVQLTQGRAGKIRDAGGPDPTMNRTGWRCNVREGTGTSWRSRVDTQVGSIQVVLDRSLRRFAPTAERLRRVSLECLPALDVIERYGHSPDVLLYVDPPYLADTRSARDAYRIEMPHPEQHRELAAALRAVKAAVVLSGYRSPLYDELYDGWYVEEIPTQTPQGGAGKATCEVLWANRPLGGRVQGSLWD